MSGKDELGEVLHKFSHLKHLEIRHHVNRNIFDSNDYFDSPPKLKSIRYTAYHDDEMQRQLMEMDYFSSYDDYLLDRMANGEYEEEDPREEEVRLSRIEPRGDIEEFIGEFIFYNTDSIAYFMHKFPSLQLLDINTNCNTQLIEDIANFGLPLSPEMMINFFNFIVRIPKFSYGNMKMIHKDETQCNSIPFITQLLESDTSHLFTNATIVLIYQEATSKWNDKMEWNL